MAGLSPAIAALEPIRRLRTRPEHGHRAAILRPARDVVAHRDRTLLAVRNRPHTVGRNTALGEVITHGLGTASAKRDVIFARAALVGVTFDRELRILAV